MNTISLNNAISDFPRLINDALQNSEETVIVGDAGSVVLIAQSEWNSIMETLKLLKDKQSLKALYEGQKSRELNESVEKVTIEDAFYDL